LPRHQDGRDIAARDGIEPEHIISALVDRHDAAFDMVRARPEKSPHP
jgi:hypothetical protein